MRELVVLDNQIGGNSWSQDQLKKSGNSVSTTQTAQMAMAGLSSITRIFKNTMGKVSSSIINTGMIQSMTNSISSFKMPQLGRLGHMIKISILIIAQSSLSKGPLGEISSIFTNMVGDLGMKTVLAAFESGVGAIPGADSVATLVIYIMETLTVMGETGTRVLTWWFRYFPELMTVTGPILKVWSGGGYKVKNRKYSKNKNKKISKTKRIKARLNKSIRRFTRGC